jgi:hypothetical protein
MSSTSQLTPALCQQIASIYEKLSSGELTGNIQEQLLAVQLQYFA